MSKLRLPSSDCLNQSVVFFLPLFHCCLACLLAPWRSNSQDILHRANFTESKLAFVRPLGTHIRHHGDEQHAQPNNPHKEASPPIPSSAPTASSRRPSANRSALPSLTDLCRRLEAATSRLEDIATSVATFDQTGSPASGSGLAIASPPAAVAPSSQALTAAAPATPSPPPKGPELPVEVEGFDKLISGELATFIKLSDSLDPLLGQQASLAGGLPLGF